MIAIKVSNLSKKFKLYGSPGKRAIEYMTMGKVSGHTNFWALRDISFEVPNGTTVGIIGQNGSGKSTLLRILAGVLEPSGGSYDVNGKVSAILELGSGFHPEFTGRDNVYMYGSIMSLSKEEIDEKFDEILNFSELGDFIDQSLRTYSSGMIIRLAFSVAVNVNSDILIVDEALAVGDAVFQHRCFQKIKEMQESGKTILYVGHDTEAVRNLCSYAMLLDGGRIIERGDPNKVVNKYHALIAERERSYNEGNLEERGEVLSEGYDVVYNFVDNLKNAKKKCLQPDYVREQVLEVKSTPRKVIFAHPPSEIEYDLKVEKGSTLAFAIGLLPGAWDKIIQGVKFDIYVKCYGIEKNIFSRALEPNKNLRERGWYNLSVSLKEYYGKDITIKFVTSGTGEDLSYCWGGWGWLKIIKPVEYLDISNFKKTVTDDSHEENLGEMDTEIRYGNKKAEIFKIQLLDANEMPKLAFNSGERAIIKVYIKMFEEIESDLSIGCIIKNKFSEIYGINTKGYGMDFGKKRKNDVIIIKFTQNLKLGIGTYSLTIDVGAAYSDNDVEHFDSRKDCILFKIYSIKKMCGYADLESIIDICEK